MNGDDVVDGSRIPAESSKCSPVDRRSLLKAVGAGVLGLHTIPSNGAPTMSGIHEPARDAGYVFRGGRVVTMEDTADDVLEADVYVRNGTIVAIGAAIAAPGAEVIDARGMIVMPGFVDTHWHLWNTVLRNMQHPGLEYFAIKAAFVEHFTPEYSYRSDRLALLEAINAGITTVNNFAHNVRSPAHADQELRAMAESGIRGRFSYGWRDPSPRGQTEDLEDIRRVKRQWFENPLRFHGRVHLGMAVRGPKYADDDVVAEEFHFARELGLPTCLHTGATKRPGQSQSVAALYAAGYLEPSTILLHWIGQNDADADAAVKSGASLSLSPTSDLRTSHDSSFHDALLMFREKHVNMCLSIDSALLAGVSMFEQMAVTWYTGVPWYDTPTERFSSVDFRTVLEMATINGAKALGLANEIGSLAPTKRADIILVRTTDINMAPLGNVYAALARVATVANVDTVMIDGRLLKRRGRIVGVDVNAILEDAEAALHDLRIRAGGAWAPKA
jgi:5-methylthioadenosine/S-adenosylhomocysteine deaminase